jgi:hypothetical protein
MNKIYTLCFFVVSLFWCNAQDTTLVENNLLKVNALLPGVSYELGLGNTTTLNLEGIVGFAVNGGSGRDTEFGIYPGLGAELRKYVNLDRRISKNKNIEGNSGNYISVLNQFQFGSPLIGDLQYSSDYYYNLAIVYGIQRMKPKGFYWSISLGPSIFRDDFDVDAGILIDARLGWVLHRRKNK